MKNFITLLLITCLLLSTSHLRAQEETKPITIGQEISMKSKVLKEERPLLIHLPNGYENSDKSYPVIYLLDGRGHFHHTSGTMQFLARSGRMPEMIIVGIPNTTDRTRDLTPAWMGQNNRFPTGGGADNLLKFMRTELFPHINEKYRTTSYKLLIGHSFGGLFAIHSLFSEPDMFNAYLAISPSLWWDDQRLVEQAETFLEAHPDHRANLYMTMGDEGGAMLGGAWRLASVLEEKSPANLTWDFQLMEEEDHGSVPHRSTYNGLEAIFKDWKIKDVYALFERGGLDAIQAHYDELNETLGMENLKAPEQMINNLGYQLLGRKKVDDAIKVFTFNVKEYPKSFNVYDSLGEGHKIKGNKEKAISYYKKSLALNPGNTNGIKMLAELGVEYKAKEVMVSKKLLKSYVGQYEVEPGVVLKVTLEDDKLMGEAPGAPKVHLVPMSKNKFYLNDENVQVVFKHNDKKEVEGLTVFQGGREMVAKKMD